ncbi:SDR family oxidoreductase [Streptomyces sp. NPDC051954]|uniref:SDR family NAD(P)-dependent oxidoreductase n=1 Tax=unclassified Streptomyces TaxID=2593676 RepID=UPI003413445E
MSHNQPTPEAEGYRSGMLENDVAIVTGAASGMGAATARRFVAEGARVILADIDEKQGAALTQSLGERAMFVETDVASSAGWNTAVEQAESAFGPVTILMNNAGVDAFGFIEHTEHDSWARSLAVNLQGPLLGMRTVIPSMRRAGRGSIINVSSLQGREAEVGVVPYIAAKFGLRGLSKAAAVELGRDGIRSNTIFPGLIRTGMTEGQRDHYMGLIPLVRAGESDRAGHADDVAALAVFLASSRSSYITGAEITIDAAKSVRFPTLLHDYSAELAWLAKNDEVDAS